MSSEYTASFKEVMVQNMSGPDGVSLGSGCTARTDMRMLAAMRPVADSRPFSRSKALLILGGALVTNLAHVLLVGVAIGIGAGLQAKTVLEGVQPQDSGQLASLLSVVVSPISISALVFLASRVRARFAERNKRSGTALYGLASGCVAVGLALVFSGAGDLRLPVLVALPYLACLIALPVLAAWLGAANSRSSQSAHHVISTTDNEHTAQPELVGVPPLTARQKSVLELAAKGFTNAEIAHYLSISVATVKTHLLHSYEKLDANDRASAVTRALQAGLIDP